MADTALKDLTAASAVEATDLFYVVKDPSGTPLNRKATGTQVAAFIDAAGAASSAVSTHVAAGDPHTQYKLESDFSANGASLVNAADYSAMRTLLSLVPGTNVQAFSSVLSTYAGINPSADVQTLLGAADYSAFRTSLGLVIGTNVQAYNANLTTYAGIAPAANVQTLLGAADYAAMRTQLGLVIGTNVQAYDADLATIAGLTATTDNFLQAKSSAWASRTPTQVTADLIAMVGDSGSGGTKGLVPAPAAGDAAASKYLKADGTWATVSGGGGGSVSDTAYGSSWDGVTTDAPSKNAVHDKFEGLIHPGYVAANWYLPVAPGIFSATAAFTANTIYYHPIYITRRVTISDLGCQITTASAGGNLKIAIYANDASTGRPSGTPLAETGSISTTSTGNVSADITGSNVTLEAGTYWVAFWSDNSTAAVRGISRDNLTLGAALNGSTTLNGLITTAGYNLRVFSSAETYGTWPNATSETFTEQTGLSYAGIPFLKAA